jgi:hypothetical protein
VADALALEGKLDPVLAKRAVSTKRAAPPTGAVGRACRLSLGIIDLRCTWYPLNTGLWKVDPLAVAVVMSSLGGRRFPWTVRRIDQGPGPTPLR